MTETATARIIHIDLASPSITLPALMQERHRAVSDLLFENSFALTAPTQAKGPYRLSLALDDLQIAIGVQCTASQHQQQINLSASSLKGYFRDYNLICDNFYRVAKDCENQRLEAIDMGRRALHNEAAESLIEALENKVILDKMTARRLFSLLYVLQLRHAPTL